VKYRRGEERLILVKGNSRSRLLECAHPISRIGLDGGGHKIHVLSDDAKKHLSSFTKLNAIQRSTPRWVPAQNASEAAEWAKGLA